MSYLISLKSIEIFYAYALQTVIIASLVICFGALIRVMAKERKIKKLTIEMGEKIQQEKQSGRHVLQPFLEGAIKKMKKNYESKIEELERDRRYILDKLPFLKK